MAFVCIRHQVLHQVLCKMETIYHGPLRLLLNLLDLFYYCTLHALIIFQSILDSLISLTDQHPLKYGNLQSLFPSHVLSNYSKSL